jgi:hypothetical protein
MIHMAYIGKSCACQDWQNNQCHPEENIAHVSLPFSAMLTQFKDM